MILDELTVRNFGVYRGEHAICLTPPSPDKPVVLVGGLNGGGKTTLVDALQLALYGKNAPCSNRGALTYGDYLAQCINTGVSRQEGAAVAIEFRHHSEGRPRRYRVERSWYATPGNAIQERLNVYCDGARDSMLGHSWAEHVQVFMPAGVSRFFLFDGEKIEALADAGSAPGLLSTAIGSLLGIDLVEQLVADLLVLERRKQGPKQSSQGAREIREAEAEVAAVEAQIRDAREQRAAACQALEQVRAALVEAETRFASQGGAAFEHHSALEARYNAVKSRLAELKNRLLALAEDATPLLVVRDRLDALAAQDEREQQAARQASLDAVLCARDAAVLEHAERFGASDRTMAALADFLARDRRRRAGAEHVPTYLDLNGEARASLATLRMDVLARVRDRAGELVDKSARARAQAGELAGTLELVPDSEAIFAARKARDDLRVEVERIKAAIAGHDAELRRLETIRERRTARLDRLVENQVKRELGREDDQRLVRHARRIRDTMHRYRTRLLHDHVRRIEALILESFAQLVRKQSLVAELAIDPDSFAVTLGDRQGRLVSPERLSAGERQLLAVSMLWGLARASGRPFPTVIDTPLSRLDSRHRALLVERYFPHASHQVLLLSTDQEIDRAHYARIKPHVGRAYVLDFDHASAATSIQNGYFW